MSGKISVIMGAYNCADTIEQAILSIQKQTYTNWEVIVCDDGSRDVTYQILERIASEDSRIILLQNEMNLGLNMTLNRCLALASGEYIARMDGDDVCEPDRFEVQVSFLMKHPEYQIVGSSMTLFDEEGTWGEEVPPEQPKSEDTVTRTAFCHATVMIRKRCIDAVGGYSEEKRTIRVEDVNLWIKLYAAGYRGYNLQQPLYRMRNDKNALHRRRYIYRINSTYVRLQGCRKLNLGIIYYFKAFHPMIVGLIPATLRLKIRKYYRKKAK